MQTYKFVWADGKIAVGEARQVSHYHLLSQLGEYQSFYNGLDGGRLYGPQSYVAGYYSPDYGDNHPTLIIRDGEEGDTPTDFQLRTMIEQYLFEHHGSHKMRIASVKELYKFVYSNGKLAVSDNILADPGVIHHHELFDQIGYNDRSEYIMGEYGGGDELFIEWKYGGEHGDDLPSYAELLEMLKTKIYGAAHTATRWYEQPNYGGMPPNAYPWI